MKAHTCADNIHMPCEACAVSGGIQPKKLYDYNERREKESEGKDEKRNGRPPDQRGR
jgi:hypothetical protein